MNKTYIIAGIAVLAVAVYFILFFQQAYTFDSGLEKINSFWEKQDLKPVDLTFPLKVYAAEESKLVSLKSDLESFQSSLENQQNSEDKEKLELLAETQLALVSNALLQKQNFASIDFFESNDYDFDVLCSSMDKAEDLQTNLVLQNQTAESCNAKILAFSESYPVEAEKAGIASLQLETGSSENLSELEDLIKSLQVVC